MKCAYCSTELRKKESDNGFKVEYEKTCHSCGGSFDSGRWDRDNSPSLRPAPGYTTTFDVLSGKTTVTDERGQTVNQW